MLAATSAAGLRSDDEVAPVLSVRDLSTTLRTGEGDVFAVRGVSFDLAPGEVLGIVGESGAGKSMLLLSIAGLAPTSVVRSIEGEVLLGGRDILRLTPRQRRHILGREITMIFQDPGTTLNPLMRVGDQIAEVITNHASPPSRLLWARVIRLLDTVGIPAAPKRVDDYPHQLSGGMRQRVGIAIAIANDPKVILADEPTTALDVTIQAQVLDVLAEARSRSGAATIFVTHDLGVIAETADRVLVMYGGRVQESAGVRRLFDDPRHPYSHALMACQPRLDSDEPVRSIPGSPPNVTEAVVGCVFAPRCPRRMAICCAVEPELTALDPKHHVACHAAIADAAQERTDATGR
jgi:oligopeptide/dipeptide ABC transporter ATP-binding protein